MIQVGRTLTQLLFLIPALLALASVAAPLLEAAGLRSAASALYFGLSYICHQTPSHALWLFGSPIGVSMRSLFLYIAFVAAGLLMLRSTRLLSWWTGLLLLMPIFADVFSHDAGLRTTNNAFRAVTGALAGAGLAVLVLSALAHLAPRVSSARLFFPAVIHHATAASLIVAFVANVVPFGPAAAQMRATIPEGTRLAIKIQETVSSETAKKGQTVRLEVVRDVEIGGRVVIKAGAPAVGEVTRAASKRMLGREGELHLAIRYATAVDGTQVPLRASLEERGEEKLTTVVVLGVVLCPLFLMMKGEEAVVEAGTEYTVFVDRPVDVTVQ